MQPPPENIFSACLAASRVSMFTRRRRRWMVTLFRDMQPPARKNFPACSGIFQAAQRRMKTLRPGTLAVQTAQAARTGGPVGAPDHRTGPGPEPQRRPEPRRRSPRRSRRRSGARTAGALPQRSRSASRR